MFFFGSSEDESFKALAKNFTTKNNPLLKVGPGRGARDADIVAFHGGQHRFLRQGENMEDLVAAINDSLPTSSNPIKLMVCYAARRPFQMQRLSNHLNKTIFASCEKCNASAFLEKQFLPLQLGPDYLPGRLD